MKKSTTSDWASSLMIHYDAIDEKLFSLYIKIKSLKAVGRATPEVS